MKTKRQKLKTPLTNDERKRLLAEQLDEKRFDIWHQIFDLMEIGYSVAEIATATRQPHAVVDDVLHGKSLNRIRRIVIQ